MTKASAPVSVEIDRDLLQQIKRTLRICADDLSVALQEEYPEDLRARVPTYERRFRAAMQPVVDARDCLDQIGE